MDYRFPDLMDYRWINTWGGKKEGICFHSVVVFIHTQARNRHTHSNRTYGHLHGKVSEQKGCQLQRYFKQLRGSVPCSEVPRQCQGCTLAHLCTTSPHSILCPCWTWTSHPLVPKSGTYGLHYCPTEQQCQFQKPVQSGTFVSIPLWGGPRKEMSYIIT